VLSKAAEEVPRPFDADRSAPGPVVADIEGEQGLALLADGSHEDRQVLVVSLAAEPAFVFRSSVVDPADRRLRKKPEGWKGSRELALKVPLDLTTHLFRGDGVDQPELAELGDEVAGSGGRRRAREKDVRVEKDADRPRLACWQGLRGPASPHLGLGIQEVVQAEARAGAQPLDLCGELGDKAYLGGEDEDTV